MKPIALLLLLPLLSPCFSHAQISKIVVWEQTLDDPGIIQDTLYRALEITKEEYGDYQLIRSTKMVQNRALRELAKNKNSALDVAHFGSTAERETQAIAIRIPIMQGLLGYRLCLIKEGTQDKFADISNKQQWIEKDIRIGQHHNWPDTRILASSGFNVTTTFKDDLLFQQLSKGRFDCFSRGINEISYELAKHPSLGLAIEDNILIHYPFPLYFFVSPQKPLLAERLTLGLTRLEKSGVTMQLFDHYYREVLNELNIKQRTFIEVPNPTLSQESINSLKTATARFKGRYLKKEPHRPMQ